MAKRGVIFKKRHGMITVEGSELNTGHHDI